MPDPLCDVLAVPRQILICGESYRLRGQFVLEAAPRRGKNEGYKFYGVNCVQEPDGVAN